MAFTPSLSGVVPLVLDSPKPSLAGVTPLTITKNSAYAIAGLTTLENNGFYNTLYGILELDKNLRVRLVSTRPCTIYYTVDGTEPTTSSPVYTDTLLIDSTTTLKFFGLDEYGFQTDVKVELYNFERSLPVVGVYYPYYVDIGQEYTYNGSPLYVSSKSGVVIKQYADFYPDPYCSSSGEGVFFEIASNKRYETGQWRWDCITYNLSPTPPA